MSTGAGMPPGRWGIGPRGVPDGFGVRPDDHAGSSLVTSPSTRTLNCEWTDEMPKYGPTFSFTQFPVAINDNDQDSSGGNGGAGGASGAATSNPFAAAIGAGGAGGNSSADGGTNSGGDAAGIGNGGDGVGIG